MLYAIFFCFFLFLGYYLQRLGGFWRKRNIDGPKPIPVFGNMFKYLTMKKHYGELFADIYNAYPKATFVGIYEIMNKPGIVIRDLDLVKDILVKNFNNFNANGFTIDEKLDALLAQSPFIAKGEKWKTSRSQIAPMFAPGKVKIMFPLMSNVCEKFVKYINENPNENEAKELCSKYTLEVVASCGFGLEAEMFTNPNSDFRKMTHTIFKPDSSGFFKAIIVLFVPALSTYLQIPFVPKQIDQWMRSITSEVIKIREKNNEKRNDVLQSILELKNTYKGIDDTVMAGYSLTVLTEGFETSSTLMSYVLYVLASKQDIQKMAQEEVDRILLKHNGQLTDDAVQDLNYLDGILYETLRVYPPVFAMTKICTERYELPLQYSDSKERCTIEPGTSIILPVYGIQNDPEHFSDPKTFNPNRFVGENKKQHNKYAFLAFGEGQRKCLGQRFGLTQSKAGIATILLNFNIKLSSKTQEPLPISKTAILLACEPGIWINFESRKSKTV